jgi:hypothetical protein
MGVDYRTQVQVHECPVRNDDAHAPPFACSHLWRSGRAVYPEVAGS